MPAKEQTVSVSRGRTVIEHDLRDYTPNNVNGLMTPFNVVLINELGGRTLAEYTNDYMKPYIDEYNAKQKRSDRKKSYDYASDYIEEQNNMQASRQNYKAGRLAYEYVIQFGDHQTMDVNEVVKDEKLRKRVLTMFEELIQSYQSSYPHMRIILATVHMDEPNGTPHMHILVQSIGEGYKQGLSKQISLTKALACDGFERSDKKSDRLSMTRWQDDIKDNIIEPILKRHRFTRAYKDGEKHHMPVELYKRTMAERDAIIEEAKVKAEEEKEQIYDEIYELSEEKERLIEGGSRSMDTPYEEWALEDLRDERNFYVNGDEGETEIRFMSIPQLKEHTEKVKAELDMTQEKYTDVCQKYDKIVDGYVRSDGKRILGYNELVKRRNQLLQDPAKVLETEEGQKVLEEAKEEIIVTVQENLLKKAVGYVRTKIFDTFKDYFIDFMYNAIGEMLKGHSFRINDNDRSILTKAVDKCISVVTDVLNLDREIERSIHENMPDKQDVEQQVTQAMARPRRRGR